MLSVLDDPLGFKKKRKKLSKAQKTRLAKSQDWKCGRCPQKIEPLAFDIHHRDGDSSNNSFGNLVALCVKCHRIVTQQQNKKKDKEKKDLFNLGI